MWKERQKRNRRNRSLSLEDKMRSRFKTIMYKNEDIKINLGFGVVMKL